MLYIYLTSVQYFNMYYFCYSVTSYNNIKLYRYRKNLFVLRILHKFRIINNTNSFILFYTITNRAERDKLRVINLTFYF